MTYFRLLTISSNKSAHKRDGSIPKFLNVAFNTSLKMW